MPFNFEYYQLERICAKTRLQYRWASCADHKDVERRLLNERKKRTGDLPPCNVRT
jgi:hypothetical protein